MKIAVIIFGASVIFSAAVDLMIHDPQQYPSTYSQEGPQ